MRVLLVEDHAEMAAMTAAHLEDRGFAIDRAGSLREARLALSGFPYDAVIIDLGLPDGEGFELLREGGEIPPALIATAREEIADRIRGLDSGADDYLLKPFSLEELEARLRAILRRPGPRASSVLNLASLSFDTVGRRAFVAGEGLALPRREGALLEALMRGQGRVVVRDLLEDQLYGKGARVTPNALEATASRLRRILEEARSGVVLETRRGVGYLLRAL